MDELKQENTKLNKSGNTSTIIIPISSPVILSLH